MIAEMRHILRRGDDDGFYGDGDLGEGFEEVEYMAVYRVLYTVWTPTLSGHMGPGEKGKGESVYVGRTGQDTETNFFVGDEGTLTTESFHLRNGRKKNERSEHGDDVVYAILDCCPGGQFPGCRPFPCWLRVCKCLLPPAYKGFIS